MTKIVKEGIVMVARDKNQLAAFLNNGWTVKEEETPKPQEDVVTDEVPTEEPKEETPKPSGRKAKTEKE